MFFRGTLFALAKISCLALAATSAHAASILVVTNNTTTSQSLVDALTANGHSVTRNAYAAAAPDTAALSAIDLIIVARETNSSSYTGGTKAQDWNAIEKPLINMAPHIMRDSRWGWVNGTSLPSLGTFTAFDSPFLQPTHPIVSGATTAILSPGVAGTGVGNSLPAAAVQIATAGGGNSHGIFVILEGTSMFSGTGTAGGVRIGFIRGDEAAWNTATANANQILENMISWSLGASASSPTIINLAATSITVDSATLNGQVTNTGGANPTVTIYYGNNDAGTNAAAWDDSVLLDTQADTFSSAITGLSPSTTYFFRSFGSSSGGDDWADSTASFTTTAPSNRPSVVNSPATSINFTGADLNGAVTSTGGETPIVTIYYGDNDGGTSPGSWDSSINIGAQASSFTTSLELINAGTTYHFRAFAQNSGGSAWAPQSTSFTTPSYSLPSITSSAATGLTGTAAQANGEVTDTGGDAPAITIYYGVADGGTTPGNWDHSVSIGPQSAAFSAPLTGLSPLMMYHYRVFAQNAAGSVWSAPAQSFATNEASELVINEFMAANNGGDSNNPNSWYPISNQVVGTTDDWIEILNTSGITLSLDGWFLSDDPLDPQKWPFPATAEVPAGGFLLIYASGSGVPDANGNLHSNFRLSAGGENLALIRPSGNIASEFASAGEDYPAQDDDISYGVHPSTELPVFFSAPTPGAPNDPSGIATVADTKFSHDRGYYPTEIDVTISTTTPGATIYYTTDGSVPVDENGTPQSSAIQYESPIHIDQITTLRAAATAPGLASTNIDTQTYILLDIDGAADNGVDPAGLNAAFLQQTQPAGYGNLTSGDYDMDPSITQETSAATGHATSTARTMLLGMRDIPTISVAMERDDFVGGNGIYTNSTSKGEAWERVCSAEFIPAANDTRRDWQENCGIRVQGGASRIPSRSPKHALSFRFRAEYGSSKLRETVFPGSAVDEFNVLALRACYNNSWIHSSADQPLRGSLIRDQWMRQTMLDMGSPAAGEGMHAHLFINGLYWGIFNVCERGDNSHYAEHNGGDSDLIDARNAAEFINGSATSFNAMTSVINAGDWSEIQQVLDVEQYIQYQLINRFGANADLKTGNNWRAAGGGPFPSGQPELMAPWQLYSWDGERIFESATSTLVPVDPFGIRTTLETNPDYLIALADQIQKHFFNDGALTPQAVQARWEKYASILDRAIIAESARWGDHRKTPAYSRDNEWLTEQSRLYNTYFPVRTANVLSNLNGLLPAIEAPSFLVDNTPQLGGVIPEGSILTVTSPEGAIYYTTDGSDPRLDGGEINQAATGVNGGGTLLNFIDLEENGWNYLDTGTAQSDSGMIVGTAGFDNGDWKHRDFDDSGWSTGQAMLGYGGINNRTVNTTIDPPSNPRHPTSYFRKEFVVSDASTFTQLEISLIRDDGAILYLNGHEIGRSNIDRGNIAYSDLASGATTNEGALLDLTTHILSPGQLVEGTNVLAVELHQSGTTSSDTGIDVILRGLQPGDSTGISLSGGTIVKARALNNGEWSALTEASFIVAPIADASNIVVSEFSYNPAGTSEDTEFIELMNIHPTDNIDLSNLTFTGIDYRFPLGVSLGAEERIVIVKNRSEFEAAYDTAGMNIAPGDFDSSLSNDGEEIALIDAFNIDARRFVYNDVSPWPTSADGAGYTLVLIDPTSSPDHSDPFSWRSSVQPEGSPSGSDGTTFSGDPDADVDGDGMSAFLEYVLGSIGGDAQVSPESFPTADTIVFDGNNYLTITYRRNLAADDVVIEIQTSNDLDSWSTLGTTFVSASNNGDGTETTIHRSLTPLGSIPREFIRLNLSSRP